MSLSTYNQKRDFHKTREPLGNPAEHDGFSYVIQKHAAQSLHFDFRLELDGVLLSWAVPKGPSLNPKVKRLAVQTEDHPVAYGSFEGTIPKGQYGAGRVEIWDSGTWKPEGDPRKQYRNGKLTFILNGNRCQGRWHLVRTNRGKTKSPQWLLFKGTDPSAPGKPSLKVSQVRRTKNRETLPDTLTIQKATLAEQVPQGDTWFHEIKLDGYRIVARLDHKKVTLLTRAGHDFSIRAPLIAAELAKLSVQNALIDGELIYLREDGISDFQKLQNVLSEGNDHNLFYYVFDIAFLNGQDYRSKKLEKRKEELKKLLTGKPRLKRVRLSDHIVGQGLKYFENACKAGLEGIVSKRRDAPYHAGRSPDWLKIKCSARQEFVIGGFSDPAGSRPHLGAILVGLWKEKDLVYCGKVGTGFTDFSLTDLFKKLSPLKQDSSPFVNPPKAFARHGVHWVVPKLIAEIKFKEFTSDGRLRHPSFCGLREDKDAKMVDYEHPIDSAPISPFSPRPVAKPYQLTHPEKILFPENGITKQKLAEYFSLVAPYLLPHVVRRPLSLLRCPEGRERSCFFQKHLHKGQPNGIFTIAIKDDRGVQDYMYIKDEAGLAAITQMGVLEIHTWGAHIQNHEKPDLLVFDLDPDSNVPWKQVVEAAHLLHDLFDQLELESFVKTTGGKGLHICVPFSSRLGWDESKIFSHHVALSLAQYAPDRYIANMSKTKRKGKIFIDYLRNGRGATFIAPYSPRARVNAPVATPVSWKELDSIDPHALTLETLPQRLADLKEDPWQNMATIKQTLSLKRMRLLNSAAPNQKKG